MSPWIAERFNDILEVGITRKEVLLRFFHLNYDIFLKKSQRFLLFLTKKSPQERVLWGRNTF